MLLLAGLEVAGSEDHGELALHDYQVRWKWLQSCASDLGVLKHVTATMLRSTPC
jgi:hypothetical protein